jgi:hypothetical protein
MHTIGTTVRLTATFRDLGALLVDPATVTVRVYNTSQKRLHEQQLPPSARVSLGVYEYDYTIPVNLRESQGDLYFEFEGIVANKPHLERAVLPLKWSRI